MNITQELQREHSRKMASSVAQYILEDHKRLAELLQNLLCEDRVLVQRAAWPLGIIGESKPDWLLPYMPQLIDCLRNPRHNAISRNIYRSLSFMQIPPKHQSGIYDLCMRDIIDPLQPTAVKAFSMSVAYNIARQHPGLLSELQLAIREFLPYASKGVVSRTRRLLAAIAKIQN